jgi:RimJ/RimL family protein N-acetyltransferase
MVVAARTEDWELIKRIATDPAIWPHISDDFSPYPEAWEPNPALTYIQVSDEEQALGFFLLVAFSPILWEVHTALLPAAWGSASLACAKALLDWVWTNTPCERLITTVPDVNRLAFRFALKAGMKKYGANPRSYQKDGILHNTILLGLDRPQGKTSQSCQ